jgi:hypothetical protein
MAFIIAMMALKGLKSGPSSAPAGALALAGSGGALALGAGAANPNMMVAESAPAIAAAPPRPAPPPITFPTADTQIRDKVISTVEQSPDAAARLLKTWIKEG